MRILFIQAEAHSKRVGHLPLAVAAPFAEGHAAQEVLAATKAFAPEIFTRAGAHHAASAPDDSHLPYVDAICLGEGERVFADSIDPLASDRSPKHVPNLASRDGEGHFARDGRTTPASGMNTTLAAVHGGGNDS